MISRNRSLLVELKSYIQKQLDLQISMDSSIKKLLEKVNLLETQTVDDKMEEEDKQIIEKVPTKERVIVYFDERIIELSKKIFDLIKEVANNYKTEVCYAKVSDGPVEGKIAFVIYSSSNLSRLEDYPKEFLKTLAKSQRTNGNVVLISVIPVNHYKNVKTHFSELDLSEIDVYSGLRLNDTNKIYCCCRILVSMDKDVIHPCDECEQNKYNVEQYINRVFYKLLVLKM